MKGQRTFSLLSVTNIGSEITPEAAAFGRAIESYKHLRQRPYPRYEEVLAVLKSLGYRLVVLPGPLPA